MEIDFSQEMKTLKGEPMKLYPGKEDVATLGDICANALTLSLEEDRKLPGKEKLKLWKLANKVGFGAKLDLEAEQVVTLKERVNKAYPSPAIVGPIWDMLDPSERKD